MLGFQSSFVPDPEVVQVLHFKTSLSLNYPKPLRTLQALRFGVQDEVESSRKPRVYGVQGAQRTVCA